MPLYDYKCAECNHVSEDVFLHMTQTDSHIELCPKCGKPMTKLINSQLGPVNFGWPDGGLTLEHVAAQPVHFPTRKSAQDYAKKHNLELGCL